MQPTYMHLAVLRHVTCYTWCCSNAVHGFPCCVVSRCLPRRLLLLVKAATPIGESRVDRRSFSMLPKSWLLTLPAGKLLQVTVCYATSGEQCSCCGASFPCSFLIFALSSQLIAFHILCLTYTVAENAAPSLQHLSQHAVCSSGAYLLMKFLLQSTSWMFRQHPTRAYYISITASNILEQTSTANRQQGPDKHLYV